MFNTNIQTKNSDEIFADVKRLELDNKLISEAQARISLIQSMITYYAKQLQCCRMSDNEEQAENDYRDGLVREIRNLNISLQEIIRRYR